MATVAMKSASARSAHKRHAIQEAGTAVFLEFGYEAATMEQIAARAGVSKQTVYNHFLSKDRLFKATIADLTAGLMEPLALHTHGQSTPASRLSALGLDLLALMLQPSSLALHRLIVAESARFPELGAEIYAVGAGRMLAALAQYLAWENRNGRLCVDDPELAAEQFLGILTGRMQLRALLGAEPLPDRAELERRATKAVECFLAIYTVRRPHSGAGAGIAIG